MAPESLGIPKPSTAQGADETRPPGFGVQGQGRPGIRFGVILPDVGDQVGGAAERRGTVSTDFGHVLSPPSTVPEAAAPRFL